MFGGHFELLIKNNAIMGFVFGKIRNPFKALKIAVKRKLGWLGTPLIVPYLSLIHI